MPLLFIPKEWLTITKLAGCVLGGYQKVSKLTGSHPQLKFAGLAVERGRLPNPREIEALSVPGSCPTRDFLIGSLPSNHMAGA